MASRRCLLWLTRALSLLAYGAALNYVIWRWRRIVDTSYWMSIPFVLSEGALLLLGSAAFYLQLAFYQRRPRARLRDLGVNQDRWPTVDVMVPCFKEPIGVIEHTIRAALEIDWPADKLTVLLLDDGGSPEAALLVERLQEELLAARPKERRPALRYVARLRKPGQPHHAKAGNLNHALFQAAPATEGQYVLVLDCDMVPKPDILQALLPHCLDVHRAWDASVALVQSPQAFANLAPGDPLNNASPLFYHVLLPGWDALGAAPCCGTNAILNRSALEAVGGFAYGSVTEDFLTSLSLQNAGYRTRFVDEVLAEGLAPSSLAPFFAQRLRWAVGGLQIFWRFNPLWGAAFRGGQLTMEQRLLYAWSGGHYLLAFPLAIVLCTPFVFLLDGGALLLTTGTVSEYLLNFGPYYILHTLVAALAHSRLGWRKGLRYFWRAQQEPVYLIFTFIRASAIVALGLPFGFQVTRKDPAAPRSPHPYQQQQQKQQRKQRNQTREAEEAAMADLANALPHALLLLIGWACLVTGFLQLLALPSGDQGGLRVAYGINMAWAALVLSGLWAPLGQVLDVGVPCWCLDAPSMWFKDCMRRAARRAGYVPIGDAGIAVAVDVEAGDREEEEGKGRKEEALSRGVGVGVGFVGKPPRHPKGPAAAVAAVPAPAPPLSPPAVQPGRREEGNNELWRKRQGSPPPAVETAEEGTPLLGGVGGGMGH